MLPAPISYLTLFLHNDFKAGFFGREGWEQEEEGCDYMLWSHLYSIFQFKIGWYSNIFKASFFSYNLRQYNQIWGKKTKTLKLIRWGNWKLTLYYWLMAAPCRWAKRNTCPLLGSGVNDRVASCARASGVCCAWGHVEASASLGTWRVPGGQGTVSDLLLCHRSLAYEVTGEHLWLYLTAFH